MNERHLNAPPQPYQQPAMGYQTQHVTHVYYAKSEPKGFSITALVLGLVSILFGFTFLMPIAALIFGLIGLNKEPAGKGMALVGVIIGGLALLVWLLIVLAFSSVIGTFLSFLAFV